MSHTLLQTFYASEDNHRHAIRWKAHASPCPRLFPLVSLAKVQIKNLSKTSFYCNPCKSPVFPMSPKHFPLLRPR